MNSAPTSQVSRLLAQINDEDDMFKVLTALFTPKELREFEKRLQIFQKLSVGISHRKIAKSLNVGVMTVTRGAKAMNEKSYSVIENYMGDLDFPHD